MYKCMNIGIGEITGGISGYVILGINYFLSGSLMMLCIFSLIYSGIRFKRIKISSYHKNTFLHKMQIYQILSFIYATGGFLQTVHVMLTRTRVGVDPSIFSVIN